MSLRLLTEQLRAWTFGEIFCNWLATSYKLILRELLGPHDQRY